jgi:hypothetical protein
MPRQNAERDRQSPPGPIQFRIALRVLLCAPFPEIILSTVHPEALFSKKVPPLYHFRAILDQFSTLSTGLLLAFLTTVSG